MNTFTDFKKRVEEDSGIFAFTKTAVLECFAFLGAALLSSINGLGTVSPFGVAFVTSVPKKYLIASCFGAAAGYIMSQDSLGALRYICAILCSAVLISLVSQFEKARKFKLLEACTAFLMLFATGMTVLFARASDIQSFAVFTGEACVGFACAYVFSGARDALSLFESQNGFEKRDLLLTATAFFLMLLSVGEIAFFGVSPARIILVFCVLLMCKLCGGYGAAFAVAAGLIFSADPNVGTAGFMYFAAGLAVGIFENVGRIFKAVLCFVTCFAVYVFFSSGADRPYLPVEAFIACLVFAIIPEKAYIYLSGLILADNEPQKTRNERKAVIKRIEKATAAVSGLGECVNAAARISSAALDGDDAEMYLRIRDEVCAGCNHNAICWTKNFSDCKRSFDLMSEMLKNNRKLSEKNLPRYLSGCCPRKSDLCEAFTHRYLQRVASRDMKRELEKMRSVTCRQMSGIQALMTEISQELSLERNYDCEAADRIQALAKDEFGLDLKSVLCSKDADNRIRIEMTFDEKPQALDTREFFAQLEQTVHRRLSAPTVIEGDGEYCAVFSERPAYRVEAAASRCSAYKDSLCGDSYEGFYDSGGNYYAVLSDGMGTGFRAAVDSSLSVTAASKLLRAGFSYRGAVNLVNTAMLLKSTQESFATLDILQINLYTGKAKFIKAGACRSLVKSKSRVTEISAASMPLGILGETDFAVEDVQLKKDDLVMLSTDGAYDYCESETADAFAVSLNESAAEISQRVLLNAKRAVGDSRPDDITVITLRLLKNK